MRRRDPPFGNDLQGDFDVKVIGGKIVHVSPIDSLSTDAHKKPSRSKDIRIKENVTTSSSQNSPSSPKEILKLPPIRQATGQVQKNKFHSAPPKLHCPTTQLIIHPVNDSPTGISEALYIFNSQLKAVQRKRPHTLEDIMRSCTRLDDLRNGTISIQELADVLYVNGVPVNMETLKEYAELNKLTATYDSSQIIYKDFINRMAEANSNNPNSKMIPLNSKDIFEPTCELNTQGYGKSSSPFLHRLHLEEDDIDEAIHSTALPSRAAMSCPERQVTTATTLGSHDSIIEEDTASDDDVLLSDLQGCFGGTRWGSHGDVQRLESALAKADKRNTGCLPAVVVSRIFHDQCVPLRGRLIDEMFMKCEAPQGMIRWTELMELIIKALPRPQLTSRLVPTNRESHPTMSSELHVNAVQQKAVSQQAEELFKMVSEQTKANKPLQKLCNALYTCDPHRTGFLDVKTAMRMIRNYNIVYRMGLDMASMELFIKVNSTKNRTYCTEASPTTAVINISLVINQLLQELGDNPDDIT